MVFVVILRVECFFHSDVKESVIGAVVAPFCFEFLHYASELHWRDRITLLPESLLQIIGVFRRSILF